MYVIGHPLLSIVSILDSILMIYSLIVLISCVLSWVNPDQNSPIVKILNQLTMPVFAFVGKYVPKVNGIDLTPYAILLGLFFIRTGILPIFETFALSLVK